ncbi:thioredoxin domain-containing protein [Roseiterribacter gracilis]|uniref:Thioredoxin domain-containing protein n=1 Tax=Roseiterribacter gracilis TaxID=2812848 RepID=A0A8S8X7K9_9PROT|nr:hypothetical protein TMPK1_06810 [Rhodospirillales bacterium TMPK1]
MKRLIAIAIAAVALSISAHAATQDQLAERSLGDAKAPVTVVEYASMTCPACALFEREGLPRLKADYIDSGKVRLVYRDYPLDQIAVKTSVALRCLPPAQFFPLKAHLFRTQESWAFSKDPIAALRQQTKLAGLSDAQLDACLVDKQLEDSILNSRLQAETYKFSGIPAFIVNDGVPISGADYDKLKAAIDKLLAQRAGK